MKKLLFLLSPFLMLGCASLYEYQYDLFPGVYFRIEINKISYMEKLDVNFVYFDLEITNKADIAYNIDLGNIKAMINGYVTVETNYASIGSVDTKLETLERGLTNHRLYFVLDETEKINKIKSFEIIEFGITPAPLGP